MNAETNMGCVAAPIRWMLAVGIIASSILAAGPSRADEAGPGKVKPMPPLETVRAVVRRHFALQSDYKPGDILSRSMVEPLFDQLGLMGWKVLDKKDILRHVPKETDFVVRALRSESGRPLMRKVASMPGGYDRLYRLSVLPHGRQTIADLIRGKGGAQFIEYLTRSPGGHNLGRMLENTPNGADFNKPVGFLFTEDALLKRIEASYRAEKKRRERSPGQRS